MIVERVERRVLGAIEFVDALTGARIVDPLRIEAPRVGLVRNASSLYVIREADKLAEYTEAFEAAPAAPTDSYPFTVSDPGRRYLARAASVTLPRKDAPATDPDSFLRPLRIELYPSAARAADPIWAGLRVLVYVKDGERRVGVVNALVKVTPSLQGFAPRFGLTDANGEAFVAIPGAPPVLAADPAHDGDANAVYTRVFGAALVVALDEQFARRGDAAPPLPVPDPDTIAARLAGGDATVKHVSPPVPQLSAGVSQRVEVEVTL